MGALILMHGSEQNQFQSDYDRLIGETIAFHRNVLALLQGKEGNVEGILHRLQRICAHSGISERDREIGRGLYKSLDDIAKQLSHMGLISRAVRRIRLKRISGKMGHRIPPAWEKVGWEKNPPQVGEEYHLHLDAGGVLKTSKVVEAGDDSFRTANSSYSVEVVKETSGQTPKPGNAAAVGEKTGIYQRVGDETAAVFYLIVRNGPLKNKCFPLTKRLTIGRDVGNDLQLPTAGVSRRHAAVQVSGDQATIEDLGSRNGTFVNQERVHEAKLAHGDVIRIGEIFIHLQQVGEKNQDLRRLCAFPANPAADEDQPL